MFFAVRRHSTIEEFIPGERSLQGMKIDNSITIKEFTQIEKHKVPLKPRENEPRKNAILY
jgi:hypothetical protein